MPYFAIYTGHPEQALRWHGIDKAEAKKQYSLYCAELTCVVTCEMQEAGQVLELDRFDPDTATS